MKTLLRILKSFIEVVPSLNLIRSAYTRPFSLSSLSGSKSHQIFELSMIGARSELLLLPMFIKLLSLSAKADSGVWMPRKYPVMLDMKISLFTLSGRNLFSVLQASPQNDRLVVI